MITSAILFVSISLFSSRISSKFFSIIFEDSPRSIPLCSKLLSKPFNIDAPTKSQYNEIALSASSLPGIG